MHILDLSFTTWKYSRRLWTPPSTGVAPRPGSSGRRQLSRDTAAVQLHTGAGLALTLHRPRSAPPVAGCWISSRVRARGAPPAIARARRRPRPCSGCRQRMASGVAPGRTIAGGMAALCIPGGGAAAWRAQNLYTGRCCDEQLGQTCMRADRHVCICTQELT
eukprot:scaffold603_cov404-Prasinococcus_capsulatus_cf.AAC.45